MEMLAIFGVCVVVAALAGVLGWQQSRQTKPGPLQIEPPGPDGVPQRAPNLVGSEGRIL